MHLLKKNFIKGIAAAIGLSTALTAGAADPLKVGFVYLGPIGDHGWSYQHEQGRQDLIKALGNKVSTSYVDNVDEGADAERVIRNMAKSGYNLIYTNSFGYMNPTIKVAKDFPNIKFEHATGYKQAKNVGTYLISTYQGRYVAGYVAAKMTKSKVIGYVASFPIPEVVRDINAIQLALNKYNPGATVKVVWISSWFDPGKEADATNALIDQGADVIFQHTDSPAPVQAAERRGVYAVGYASDVAHFAPKAVLTSIVNNWGPYYIKTTQSVIDGTWKSEDHWGGFNDDMIRLPMSNLVPADVKKEAEGLIASMRTGSFSPFTGPIKDQSGKIRIPAGQVATHKELASMNYYVEGIKAELPK